MNTLGHIDCSLHGQTRPAFVCRHLVRGDGLGFFSPNRSLISDDESDELQSWCADCERVRQEQGEWNDVSEGYAGITMICDNCFEAARNRNSL